VRILAAFLFLGVYGLWAQTSFRPYQAIASHITPKGIGYREGYTSLALFFAWPKKNSEWTFLADVRSHVFNEGKIAINSGLAVRYQNDLRLYGVNAYYDFRRSHASYNQISLAFESLGRRWDFRLNGYLPVGKREATYGTAFLGIQDRVLVFSHKREFALASVQAEAAFHGDEGILPYSFSLGPYWLHGRGKQAFGAETRFTLDLGTYLRLEANVSYDHFFRWIGQGRLALNIPFGPRRQNEPLLAKLSLKRTCRREIIPLYRDRFKAPAIDKNGSFYFF